MSEHDSTHITIMHANFFQLLYAHGHPHLTGVGATAFDNIGVRGRQKGCRTSSQGLIVVEGQPTSLFGNPVWNPIVCLCVCVCVWDDLRVHGDNCVCLFEKKAAVP
jgi:hypothetical protein